MCIPAFADGNDPESPSQLVPIGTLDRIAADNSPAGAIESAVLFPWRSILIAGDHGPEDIHHDNIYVQMMDGGPVLYYTSIPARRGTPNVLADPGLLFHFFSRDGVTYTVYATSSYEDGWSSELSLGLSIEFIYDTCGCTEQTVPIGDAGEDQIVLVGTEVTLDATASYDPYGPDTDDLIYRWECYAAPEEVLLSDDGKTAITRFTPTTLGHYYFRLFILDQFGGGSFNRSPVAYVRIAAVEDPSDPNLLEVNAGRLQEVEVGDVVILDGSQSESPSGTSYVWEQTNPVGIMDLSNLADAFGMTPCSGPCYASNFDADSDVDGIDLALLANNWGAVSITNASQLVAQFVAGIARPHIFKLTLSKDQTSVSETTIVAVHHPNVSEVLTPPPVEPECLIP
jgi:hypothetical protein